MEIKRQAFGVEFAWGVSTAAYQVEGAQHADGKTDSIWDVFTQRRRKIYRQQHGNIACDFYHRYAADIDMIQELNIPNYRFSISWTRILPQGTGSINMAGIGFYNRVIDYCLQKNIEPWITLYHWDLPQCLQQKGGWTNRDIVGWFMEFVKCCTTYFGDRVKHWIILNEPVAFTGAGYFLGVHAPGKRGLGNFLPAVHHAAMCQAMGGRQLKAELPQAMVGSSFSYSHIEPSRPQVRKDVDAGIRMDALMNRLFIEPLLGMGYPWQDLPVIKRIEKFIRPGDEALLQFDMDFIGLQVYTREMVSHAPLVPFVRAKFVKAQKRKQAFTDMGWEVYPPCIYYALKRLQAYPGIKKIIVTENGAAFPDILVDGAVHDTKRTRYLQEHIAQVLEAKEEGIPVNGYFVWTLMDNFEWAEGYRPRFGLLYVNFETQERIIKDSGKWYREFLGGEGG